MSKERLCCICGKSLDGYRSHAKTCGLNCRNKLSRSVRKGSVLVSLRLPIEKYTRYTINALATGKTISDLICGQLK